MGYNIYEYKCIYEKKVTDLKAIAEAGIMMTPGLVINGKVKAYGRVPRREEIKRFIKEEL
ncbi:MAG: redox-active disulfide protein 2 [Peptococcaceae bacterium]|nr:redox-active disulfide protein 2 [Peptococcaceae bacterium]